MNTRNTRTHSLRKFAAYIKLSGRTLKPTATAILVEVSDVMVARPTPKRTDRLYRFAGQPAEYSAQTLHAAAQQFERDFPRLTLELD